MGGDPTFQFQALRRFLAIRSSDARPDSPYAPKKPIMTVMCETLLWSLPITCGFDIDPICDATAHRVVELHPAFARLRPPAKDWNDALRLPLR